MNGYGYGSRTGTGTGSIPLTSESGSGRPKNMWIRDPDSDPNPEHWWTIFSAINYWKNERKCPSTWRFQVDWSPNVRPHLAHSCVMAEWMLRLWRRSAEGSENSLSQPGIKGYQCKLRHNLKCLNTAVTQEARCLTKMCDVLSNSIGRWFCSPGSRSGSNSYGAETNK